MNRYDNWYNKLPHDEEDRRAMINFWKLEQECDAHNYTQIREMDTSHLGKGKINSMNAAVKRWHKETSRQIKAAKTAHISYMAIKREWILQ